MILWLRSRRNCRADSCIVPSDSTAMGWKRNWVPRSAYLAVLRSAPVSTADPVLLAAASKYDVANRQTAVMSHVRGFPPVQGTRVIPSGHLPSVRDIPLRSLVTGMPAETNEWAMRSFRAWCLAGRPYTFLQMKLWIRRWPWASTSDPQWLQCVTRSDTGVERTLGYQAAV